LGKEKQKSIIIGSKGKEVKGGRYGTKLSHKTKSRPKQSRKEVEEQLGKRKIGVLEEERQLRWGRKNGGEFNLK
jgi:hypothetical protein